MEKLRLFGEKQVRSVWNEERALWYFSIVDVVGVLTDSPNPRKYWSVLKTRLKKEGSQLTTTCSQLKLTSADGKAYLTDVADTEQLLRLIQSIPSPKAEPVKQWLARVGYECIEETDDPELAIDRAMASYLRKGYSPAWVNQRLKSLKTENLRDHMTNLELVLNMLAEATTTEITREQKPEGLDANRKVARRGGTIAGNTRKEIEANTGKKIVTATNAKKMLK